MKNLDWFGNWYNKQTLKNEGTKFDIKINSQEDSGWELVVDLSRTEFAKKEYQTSSKKSEHNFYEIFISDKKFIGKSDFSKLDFLIGKFREFIGEAEMKYSIKKDYFLTQDIQRFIFENENDDYIYSHYTESKAFAENIIKSGFEFFNSFDKTTDELKNDTVELNYSHYRRKPYGDYIVIISISKKLYKYYSEKISHKKERYIRIEEILCEKDTYYNDGDEVNTLSNKFVKGFVNYRTGEIIKNPDFNPDFNCKLFEKQFKKML